ncbi:MAG: FixH family protein [Hyphomicrobiaceae bacterium]
MKDMNLPPERLGTPKPARELTGRTVLMTLVGFFGIIFAVNFYFAFVATTTYTGVVSKEPYRKGLAYNKRIAADERQADLRWNVDVDVGREGHAKLIFKAFDNQPVTNLKVTATIGRPASDAEDRQLTFAETQPGQYEANGAALGSGGWVFAAAATLVAGNDGEPLYRLRKRLWLTP